MLSLGTHVWPRSEVITLLSGSLNAILSSAATPPNHRSGLRAWPILRTYPSIPRVHKLAICDYGGKRLHFPISSISLKGGSWFFKGEGWLRINVPKIQIYTDIFSPVCAYAISGKMPMKLVILVEWRGRGREGVRWQDQGAVTWGWRRVGGAPDFINSKANF